MYLYSLSLQGWHVTLLTVFTKLTCNFTHCPYKADVYLYSLSLQFYLIINVAVGAMTGIMPDDAVNRNGEFPKPWRRNQTWKGAKNSFLSKKKEWHWTWMKSNGEPESLVVDYIRVYDSKSFISNGNKYEGKKP